jgi:hypothetical protein
MQKFTHRADGRIQLKDSNLCMMLGADSGVTFSPDHRWRSLYMENCNKADAKRSIWQFSIPEEP